MKKLLLALVLGLGLSAAAKADGLPDQLLVTLSKHVIGATEFTTHGQTKLVFIDGLVQFGHYKHDYILALDGGFCNSLAPDAQGHLATTWGGHLHALSALDSFLNLSPSLAQTLQFLELTPRWSYDTDVHHGVLGVTFGAHIPFE